MEALHRAGRIPATGLCTAGREGRREGKGQGKGARRVGRREHGGAGGASKIKGVPKDAAEEQGEAWSRSNQRRKRVRKRHQTRPQGRRMGRTARASGPGCHISRTRGQSGVGQGGLQQAGEGGRESRLEGDRLQSHEQGSGGEQNTGNEASTTRTTCLVLQLGSGQALLHSHPPPTPRIPVCFFWDVRFREEACGPRQALRRLQARVLMVRASTAPSTPRAPQP